MIENDAVAKDKEIQKIEKEVPSLVKQAQNFKVTTEVLSRR